MKKLYLIAITSLGCFLSACTDTDATLPPPPPPIKHIKKEEVIPPPTCHIKKSPLNVSLLTNKKPNAPYQVLGKAIVSKYNQGGNKRQEATIRDMMRQLAASLNGDAIIDLNHDDKTISGKVIAFKPVLV
jgi:hypothetical protein